MKIEQLMTEDVVSCQPDESLDHAARIMLEKDCGFVPITESSENSRIVGVVTDRDICMASYNRGQPLPQIRVRDVMSTGIRTCKPSDDLDTAESALREAQVHRLPVVDDADHLLGVISIADIAREAAREVGLEQQMVTAAEVGATLVGIRQPRVIEAAN
jgi:CBS domain-containing protein